MDLEPEVYRQKGMIVWPPRRRSAPPLPEAMGPARMGHDDPIRSVTGSSRESKSYGHRALLATNECLVHLAGRTESDVENEYLVKP